LEPHFSPAHYSLGLAYLQLGRHDESIAEFRQALEGSQGNPAPLAALGHAQARKGDEREAREVLDRMARLSRRSYVSSYLCALIHAELGEEQAAFECLETAIIERDSWLVWLKTDPRFDALRPTPRFRDILLRIGFEP